MTLLMKPRRGHHHHPFEVTQRVAQTFLALVASMRMSYQQASLPTFRSWAADPARNAAASASALGPKGSGGRRDFGRVGLRAAFAARGARRLRRRVFCRRLPVSSAVKQARAVSSPVSGRQSQRNCCVGCVALNARGGTILAGNILSGTVPSP
jgi:hypothetical protein